MQGWLEPLRRNLDAVIAIVLVYTVIAIYLGPVFFFVAWFLNGCGYIIWIALRR
jgi:hypothetical protein